MQTGTTPARRIATEPASKQPLRAADRTVPDRPVDGNPRNLVRRDGDRFRCGGGRVSDGRDGAPEERDDAGDGESVDGAASLDGGHASATPSTHTVRLELVDEPGQLLAALHPIADNGGNLLSIYHERGTRPPPWSDPGRGRLRGNPGALRGDRRGPPERGV